MAAILQTPCLGRNQKDVVNLPVVQREQINVRLSVCPLDLYRKSKLTSSDHNASDFHQIRATNEIHAHSVVTHEQLIFRKR